MSRRAAILGALLLLAGCAGPPPPGSYRVRGQVYTPVETAEGYTETGYASWYGPGFHGRKTANGETYDMYARTAAHKLLPLGTVVEVTNLENGRTVRARINDRGPFVRGRIIDLSYTLARDLGMVDRGVARVRVRAVAGAGGTPAPVRVEGPFAWQVGAFTAEANARRLAARLEPRFGPVRIQRFDRGDAVFHRVRVGRYARPGDAEPVRAALMQLGFTPFLVHLDRAPPEGDAR